MEHLIREHNIDPHRMENMYEDSYIADYENRIGSQQKHYSTRGRSAELIEPEFGIVNRVTLLSTMFAEGVLVVSIKTIARMRFYNSITRWN